MKMKPAIKLHKNTIHAKTREKWYLINAPFGKFSRTWLLSYSIDESKTCITAMLQAARKRDQRVLN